MPQTWSEGDEVVGSVIEKTQNGKTIDIKVEIVGPGGKSIATVHNPHMHRKTLQKIQIAESITAIIVNADKNNLKICHITPIKKQRKSFLCP